MHNDLQIITLRCAIENWSSPEVRKLFTDVIAIKLEGYGKEYPRGCISFDTSDFFCDHLMICARTEFGYKPLLAYKSVTLQAAEMYKQVFTPLAIARNSNAPGHEKRILELIGQNSERKDLIRYCSAYTIHPEARNNRPLVHLLKNIFPGLHASFHMAEKTRVSLLCGVEQFKIPEMLQGWGYELLTLDGQELPSIRQFSLDQTPVKMLLLPESGFSFLARRAVKEYESLWKNRIEITHETASEVLKKAA